MVLRVILRLLHNSEVWVSYQVLGNRGRNSHFILEETKILKLSYLPQLSSKNREVKHIPRFSLRTSSFHFPNCSESRHFCFLSQEWKSMYLTEETISIVLNARICLNKHRSVSCLFF